MGMRGGRGARGGGMMAGGLTSPLRGRGRGGAGRGAAPRGAGALRGTAMKRKAADSFSMASDAKRMATGGAGGDSWTDDSFVTQPIAQQPLADTEWYQDTW